MTSEFTLTVFGVGSEFCIVMLNFFSSKTIGKCIGVWFIIAFDRPIISASTSSFAVMPRESTLTVFGVGNKKCTTILYNGGVVKRVPVEI